MFQGYKFLMSPRIRWLINTFSLWRICTFASLFLIIFYSGLFASECFPFPDEIARRYLDADLVIVGDVIGCSTKVVEEKDTLGDDGGVYHSKKFLIYHTVRVDSVIKGCYADSTILIQNKYPKGYSWRSISFNDSSGLVEMSTAGISDVSVSDIPDAGKFIILIKKEDRMHISTLCDAYSKANIDFYREVEEKGEDYFKRYEPLTK